MRCKACNVEIITPAAVCPLCGGPLDGTGEKLTPAYPEFVEKRKHYYILRRILLFFSIAAALVSLTANLLFTPHIWWFVFVFTGLLYADTVPKDKTTNKERIIPYEKVSCASDGRHFDDGRPGRLRRHQ